jgi:uncharacterized repeat protein (TIGR03803 family)
LHTFDGLGFHLPGGLTQGSDGNFYGVTLISGAGPPEPGAAFRLTPQGTLTFLHTFTRDEGYPDAPLLRTSDGAFIVGTDHNLFRMTTGGALTVLHRFTTLDGERPRATVFAGDGRFYGLALGGGITSRGTVFGMTAAGALTAVNPFIVDDAPLYPLGRLVPTGDGSFYGTSCFGGLVNAGAIFRITSAGDVTTIHSFSYLDGLCPFTLLRAADGQYYGVAVAGGLANVGTVFRMTPSGAVSVLHTFVGLDGATPTGLMQASDGAFYGTTRQGGLTSFGAAFKITAAGVFTLLHSFIDSEGRRPMDGLVQAGDGNFYGTTMFGLTVSGTIFKMTPAGAVSVMRALGSPCPCLPSAPLLLAADGKLYGTTGPPGFPPSLSSLFVVETDGDLTELHVFNADGSEGSNPAAAMIQGADGDFYGTTYGPDSAFVSGEPNVGTVFKATAAGAVTVLHMFTRADGGKPLGPLTQTSDGALVGTTFRWGGGRRGVIFRITLTP